MQGQEIWGNIEEPFVPSSLFEFFARSAQDINFCIGNGKCKINKSLRFMLKQGCQNGILPDQPSGLTKQNSLLQLRQSKVAHWASLLHGPCSGSLLRHPCYDPNYGRPMKSFFIEIPNFWAWADKFWGIWGILGRFISTQFAVSPLSMFSINQPWFLQKTLYPHPKYLSGIGIWIWAAMN